MCWLAVSQCFNNTRQIYIPPHTRFYDEITRQHIFEIRFSKSIPSPLIKPRTTASHLQISPRWTHIRSIAKDLGKMIGYRYRKYLTLHVIPYLSKSQIRPQMENCCHIWPGAASSSISSLDESKIVSESLLEKNYFPSTKVFFSFAFCIFPW